MTETTVVCSVDDQNETVVSTVTTVQCTTAVYGTVSVTVAVTATDVPFVELHVQYVMATVTVYGTVVSTHFGEQLFTTVVGGWNQGPQSSGCYGE